MTTIKNLLHLWVVLLMATAVSACGDNPEMHRPNQTGELVDVPGVHVFNAPLYWSVYEYCYKEEQLNRYPIDITADHWDEIIDWVSANLLPYGYDMVCTDGFCAMLTTGSGIYMDTYGTQSLTDIIAKCQAKGLRLGVYDNPLWIHCPEDRIIPGTNYTVGSLRYDKEKDKAQVKHPNDEDKWFHWVVADHPGAKEYIDGFFKYYKSLGVDYIRMDFLSWYEDGYDRGMGTVGHGYGRDSYAKALQYIAEAATKYHVFTSLVMPHLYEDCKVEGKYGNMVRVVCDTQYGGWGHTSSQKRGQSFSTWPTCDNQFDGFTYWSHVAGEGKVILDGDFICLNQYSSDAEKEFVISLQLMAGGPVTCADQPSTIKEGDLAFYTNEEMLALNRDRFVGHPLNDKLNSENSNIWYGQMSDGSWIVALFNRDETRTMTVRFADLGISGSWNVRDLWKHTDEGNASSLTASIPTHGCKVVKLTN